MSSYNNGEAKVILPLKFDSLGYFIDRPNRFIGRVRIGEKVVETHVHDSGRLEELLFPGNRVLLKRYENPRRKTQWEVIAAQFKNHWILTNSKFHRRISQRILEDPDISPFSQVSRVIPEVKLGDSRIDFLVEADDRIWVEVKGCTLKIEHMAVFPDAPTSRGRRHVEELKKALARGDRAALLILVFHPDARCFAPNSLTDPDFSKAYHSAISDGLEVYSALLEYDGSAVKFLGYIPLC